MKRLQTQLILALIAFFITSFTIFVSNDSLNCSGYLANCYNAGWPFGYIRIEGSDCIQLESDPNPAQCGYSLLPFYKRINFNDFSPVGFTIDFLLYWGIVNGVSFILHRRAK